jgi:hypothetical protein
VDVRILFSNNSTLTYFSYFHGRHDILTGSSDHIKATVSEQRHERYVGTTDKRHLQIFKHNSQYSE